MDDQKKAIIENYVNSYNNFDISGMIKDLSDDIVFENIANGNLNLRTEGILAFEEQAIAAKQYFTVRKQTIESWDNLDSGITIAISYKATLAIDLPNGLKAGDSLDMKGESNFEFKNGVITRITDKS